MKIEIRPAIETERLNIDEEAETLPEGVEVVDFGEESVFCQPSGDYVVILEGVPEREDGTYLMQSFDDGGFVKKV